MPWTIKELADEAGVTKQTIMNRLDRDGLRSWHVTERPDGSLVIDDDAARLMLAKYPVKVRASHTLTKDSDASATGSEADALYDALREQIADLRRERDRLAASNDELTRQNSELSKSLARQADEMKALPAPDAVDRAREDGRRDGVKSGEAEGRESEREKIASMGFWKRRRYLRGDG